VRLLQESLLPGLRIRFDSVPPHGLVKVLKIVHMVNARHAVQNQESEESIAARAAHIKYTG
jgi:hypothetical protein